MLHSLGNLTTQLAMKQQDLFLRRENGVCYGAAGRESLCLFFLILTSRNNQL